jgi:hypothetical protein
MIVIRATKKQNHNTTIKIKRLKYVGFISIISFTTGKILINTQITAQRSENP